MLLSDQFTLVDTRSGDATANDLREDKKAFVDGIEITGTLPRQDILLDWDFKGASGVYLPVITDAALRHPDITLSNVSNMNRNSQGITHDVTPGSSIKFHMPAFSATYRRYILTIDLTDTGFSSGLIDWETNYVGGDDHVINRIIHNGASSWLHQLYTVVGGSVVLRFSTTINASIQDAYATLIVDDYGDLIVSSATAIEKGTTSVFGNSTNEWYESSRSNKSVPDIFMNFEQAAACRVKNIIIMDMP